MEQLNKWLTPLNTLALVVMAFVMLVGGNQSAYGGSTSATWTAANLVSEGTLTVAGATTLSSTISATDADVSNLVSGGASLATTTNAAGTFTAAQVCDNNLIVATPNVGAVTLTFPTAAQLIADCLPTIGDEKTIRLQNATTTTGANSILTLADGANGDHQEQEGATTLVEGTEWAEITFMNIDGTNHLMLVSVTQVAD